MGSFLSILMKVNQSPRVKQFIEEIVALSRNFGMSISHEDSQGAFIINEYDENNIKWLQNAFDETA